MISGKFLNFPKPVFSPYTKCKILLFSSGHRNNMKSSVVCLASPTTNIDYGLLSKQAELCPSLPGDSKEPEYDDHSGLRHGAQT